MGKIVLLIDVLVDDWTAERAIFVDAPNHHTKYRLLDIRSTAVCCVEGRLKCSSSPELCQFPHQKYLLFEGPLTNLMSNSRILLN